MDTQDITRKAKLILRKHNVNVLVGSIAGLLVLIAAVFLSESLALQFFVALAFFLYLRIFSVFISYKDIFSHMNVRMDAQLYYEIVKQGRFVGVAGIYQIQAESFVGHYANVIGLCSRKLAEKRIAKRSRYFYLYYLAKTYFNLGEDERLRDVCDRFYAALASERKRERIFKRFDEFSLFNNYLNGNFNACKQHLSKTQKLPLAKIDVAFSGALVALRMGETEEARLGFERVLAEAPLTYYAKHSETALQAMENGVGYREATASLTQVENPAPLAPPAVSKAFSVYGKVVGVAVAVLLFMLMVLAIWQAVSSYDWGDGYWQDIEALVAADHGEAEILDVFDLEKDGFWVDAMFLCKTSDSILVGSIYYYTDDIDTLYYEAQVQLPIEALLADGFRQMTHTYDAVTEECVVTSGFYADKKDIPKSYYSVSFELEGKIFWFAVTKIVDGVYSA